MTDNHPAAIIDRLNALESENIKLSNWKEVWSPIIAGLLERVSLVPTPEQMEAITILVAAMGPRDALLAILNPTGDVREKAEERDRDASLCRWMIENAAWHRNEDYTSLVVKVEQGADLSCYATRHMAARRAKFIQETGETLRPLPNPERSGSEADRSRELLGDSEDET
jgi:hypothetical protein